MPVTRSLYYQQEKEPSTTNTTANMRHSDSPYGGTVLILGGGQLAWMLALQGHKMGLKMAVLSSSKSDPAASVASTHYEGNYKDATTIVSVIRKCNPQAVTIESEFIPASVLERVYEETRVTIGPSPSTIGIIQDRLLQKQTVAKYGLRTADFVAVSNLDELDVANRRFDSSFVLKKRMNGFDGRGTTIIRNEEDYVKLCKVIKFDDLDNPLGFIAEELMPFEKEYALQSVRNSLGDLVHFPLVETVQVNRQLDRLMGPIEHDGIAPLIKKLKEFMSAMHYIGALGTELFLINGDFWVNELAPRVHNSGHHTLNTCNTDQFTLHLRAVLGWPLIRPHALNKFAMVNLIGTGVKGVEPPTISSNSLWWYAKESKGMRKLGHVTAMGSEMDECLSALLHERGQMHL